MRDDRRTPVIVGAAQLNDRPVSDAEGLLSLQLMAQAVRLAEQDAGAALIAAADWLGVVRQMSCPEQDDMPALLPDALGAAPAHVEQTALSSGETPVQLINDAAIAIAEGRAGVAIVVGGEALRTSARLAAARGEDASLFKASKRTPSVYRQRYGLINPVEIYALYENACRAAFGQTHDEAQAETAAIWSLMSKVAAANPGAWLRQERSPAEIVEASAGNRPIAFPYNKLMVANASVNQGAALILTSLARARELSVAEEKIVHVGRGAAAHESDDPLARARWDYSPGMTVTLNKVMELNGLEVGDLDHVELYSCFPCVPKMARRVLGWPLERPVTTHGGLTFGGGPMGAYMVHGAVSMVHALRASGTHGLLFANGGHCTHNHAILLSKSPRPADAQPGDYDFQGEADRMRGPIPELTDQYEGGCVLETYTVLFDRDGAARYAPVMCREPGGRRVVALADGEAALRLLTNGVREPIGSRGVTRRDGEVLRWAAAG